MRLLLKADRPRTQLLFGAELNVLVQVLASLAVAFYTYIHIYIYKHHVPQLAINIWLQFIVFIIKYIATSYFIYKCVSHNIISD